MTPLAVSLEFLPAICRDLLQVGLGLLLQSTLLLAVGLLAAGRLGRRGPAEAALVYRATLLATVLGGLLALALGGRWQPPWVLALPAARAADGELSERAMAQDPPVRPRLAGGPGLGLSMTPARREASRLSAARPAAEAVGGPPVVPEPGVALPSPPASLTFRTTRFGWACVLLVGLWLGGAVRLLASLAAGYMALVRLRRASRPAEGEVVALLHRLCAARGVRPPPLRVSPRGQSPVLIGLRRPAILLPASYAQDFGAEALTAVLAHELAHLERQDCAWLLLARLAGAIGWVQPLLGVLARRLQESSEAVCDQEVLRRDVEPHLYARCLVELAERLVPSRAERALGAGIAPGRSGLERRVRSILSGSHRAAAPLTARLRTAITLGAGAATAAGLTLGAAALHAPAKDPLADDARLAQRVRVTAEGLPVSDLLSQLAAKTGITLAAVPDIGDDKVIVFGPARPLRDLLADLAALFNDRWERRKARDGSERYTLVRDLPARNYEAGLRRAVTDRMLTQLEGPVRAVGETPEQLARRPDDDPVRKLLTDPKSRLAVRLYALLSAEQRQALFARGRLSIRFAGLTPEQQTAIREVFTQVISEEQEVAESERKAGFFEPVSQPQDLAESGFRFEARSMQTITWVELLLGHSQIAIGRVDNRAFWLLPPHGNPYTGEKGADAAALPPVPPIHAAAAGKAWPDRLRKLAAGSGMSVMADYYRVPPVMKPWNDQEAPRGWALAAPPEERPEPPANAAGSALDTLCEPDGYLWWVRGKSLLLRKRDWYRQQLYEVPDRWLLAVIERLQAQKGVPTYGDVLRVLELTREQTMGLNSMGDESARFGFSGQLRELLAMIQAGPKDPGKPLSMLADHMSPAAWQRTWLKYPMLTPAQRVLLGEFLDDYPYPVPFTRSAEFQARMIFDPGTGERRTRMLARPSLAPAPYPDYRTASVMLQFSLGDEKRLWVNFLSLPASVPDDRRDRTRIEVASQSG